MPCEKQLLWGCHIPRKPKLVMRISHIYIYGGSIRQLQVVPASHIHIILMEVSDIVEQYQVFPAVPFLNFDLLNHEK